MQPQQHADYDLLAVFSDENAADTAEAKLHKEGFNEEEVFRLAAGKAGGEYREHGPGRDRGAIFLQTTRSGPNPVIVILLAIIFGLLLGGIMLVAHFAVTAIPELPAVLVGAIVGVILGTILGLLRRGPIRGAIGQNMTRTAPARPAVQGARTVVALRLPDTENIIRKSRARAILLNNGGKLDRSVGRDT